MLKRSRLRRILRVIVIIVLLAAAVYLLLEKSLTRVMLDTAHARANAMTVDTMNEAVRRSVQDAAVYDQLISIRTDQAGRITMLSANTARMNELAASVAIAAQDALTQNESMRITVPLGAALNVPFFSTLGPKIAIRVVPVGAVNASFATEFEAAGINQTRHKIFLELRATVRLLLPTGAKAVTVDTQVLIAESIIVGDVPQSFVQVPELEDTLNFFD